MSQNDDTISRQAAIELAMQYCPDDDGSCSKADRDIRELLDDLENLPSAQPTLYGYNMEHLKLIAEVLRKENLSPERVAEALTDVGRIVSIVRAEFEEELRKAVERCRYQYPYIEHERRGVDKAIVKIANLQSAEPEIVRCKDCLYGYCEVWLTGGGEATSYGYCERTNLKVLPYDFCSKAERRTDEGD